MLHNHLDMFKKRENIVEIEEGKLLSPKFDNDGLIPVITMCSKTRDILMHGYMNVEAFKKTIETKEAHYFSRSRQQIWHKGKTSGFTQKVTEIRIDDDQDSIWLTVDMVMVQFQLVMVQVVMLVIDHVFIDQFHWDQLKMVEKLK